MDSVGRRWLVEGRVQGVFFRQSTCEEARSIGGLTGFVRNLSDGSVEVVAHGAEAGLKRLLAYIHQGPPSARVERVREVDPAPAADLRGFEVCW